MPPKSGIFSYEEMHSKVEYIVAHGISTMIDEHKVIIGSAHFVFEDEHCVIPDGMKEKLRSTSRKSIPICIWLLTENWLR